MLLLLVVGFLIGLSIYQSRGGTFPGGGPAQAPSSGVTPRFQRPHPGSQARDLTILKQIGTAPASSPDALRDKDRLHNLVYLRDWNPGNDPINDGGVGGDVLRPGASGTGEGGHGFGGPGFTSGAGGGGAPEDERTPIDFTRDSQSPPRSDSFAPPDISIAVSAVPEPQSWILMILGFGAAGLMMRRRLSSAKLLSP